MLEWLWVPVGLLYINAGEWFIHRFVLHGLGRKRGTFWAFHWSEHHRAARRQGMFDPDYERSIFGWHAQSKEALGLLVAALVHVPLFWVQPFFAGAVVYAIGNYYYRHRRSHLDPAWGYRNLRAHYEHHMGRDQDVNWCVSRPWFDWILGTRVHYPELQAPEEASAEPAVPAMAAANEQQTESPTDEEAA